MSKRITAFLLCLFMAWSASVYAHGPQEQPVPSAPEAQVTAVEAEAEAEMVMLHPGLPDAWLYSTLALMGLIALWALFVRPSGDMARSLNLAHVPGIGALVRFLNRSPYPLLALRIVSVGVLFLVIIAGFFGNPAPEHNLATTLVWNIWWPLVVVAVIFIGSAWCAVCPWDTLSSWIVRRRWWRRASPHPGLNLKVPPYLRNVWAALLLFVALSWLELGARVTTKPFMTAALGLVMLGLSIAFLFIFERKAFCRYACPVGRTLGFYSRLSPIAVRPVDQSTCDGCKSMECYHGSKEIEPCPSSLVVGRFSQNTFCLSCGNCVLSCPHDNVSWRLRTMDAEAGKTAVPGWDGAWFMLGLLGITSFHGVTMIPQWNDWLLALARSIGESGQLLTSFALGMLAAFALPVLVYAAAIGLLYLVAPRGKSYRRLFGAFSFTALPLAFAYHLAHNMDHLLREGGAVLRLLGNPLGTGLEPLSSFDRHEQMMALLFPEQVTFTLQAGFMVLGFWLAVQIARHQARRLLPNVAAAAGLRLVPVLLFFFAVTAQNLWLMAQDMEMRF